MDNQNKLSLTDTNINDTCDKMAAVLCDVHAIDGPWQGPFQFPDGWPIVHLPVPNLERTQHRAERAHQWDEDQDQV